MRCVIKGLHCIYGENLTKLIFQIMDRIASESLCQYETEYQYDNIMDEFNNGKKLLSILPSFNNTILGSKEML